MARIRRGKGVPYYTLARDTILSKNLSLKAKALLAILLNLQVGLRSDRRLFLLGNLLPVQIAVITSEF